MAMVMDMDMDMGPRLRHRIDFAAISLLANSVARQNVDALMFLLPKICASQFNCHKLQMLPRGMK